MTGLRGIFNAMLCGANAPAIYYIFANVFLYTWVRRPSTARGKTPCFINKEELNFPVMLPTIIKMSFCRNVNKVMQCGKCWRFFTLLNKIDNTSVLLVRGYCDNRHTEGCNGDYGETNSHMVYNITNVRAINALLINFQRIV